MAMVAAAASLARAGPTTSSRSWRSVTSYCANLMSSSSSSLSSCCALLSASSLLPHDNFSIGGSNSRRNASFPSATARGHPLNQTALLNATHHHHDTTTPRRSFVTVTPSIFKIHSMNSDLPESEIQKIIDAELAKIAQEKITKEYRDWKPGMRKRPLVMSYRLEDFEEEASGIPSRWNPGLNKRCGALGIKLGMMPLWDKWGERHPCTVLYLDSNIVLRNKSSDSKEGYDAVQIGAGERKAKNVTKPLMGHYAKWGVAEHPPYIVREFRVSSKEAMPPPGTQIHARHFVPGQNVDIAGISKGKGFQGGMKRHGFKGMPASHGTSLSHRAIGSTVSGDVVGLIVFLISLFACL